MTVFGQDRLDRIEQAIVSSLQRQTKSQMEVNKTNINNA